jgi:hypothetical protein
MSWALTSSQGIPSMISPVLHRPSAGQIDRYNFETLRARAMRTACATLPQLLVHRPRPGRSALGYTHCGVFSCSILMDKVFRIRARHKPRLLGGLLSSLLRINPALVAEHHVERVVRNSAVHFCEIRIDGTRRGQDCHLIDRQGGKVAPGCLIKDKICRAASRRDSANQRISQPLSARRAASAC